MHAHLHHRKNKVHLVSHSHRRNSCAIWDWEFRSRKSQSNDFMKFFALLTFAWTKNEPPDRLTIAVYTITQLLLIWSVMRTFDLTSIRSAKKNNIRTHTDSANTTPCVDRQYSWNDNSLSVRSHTFKFHRKQLLIELIDCVPKRIDKMK